MSERPRREPGEGPGHPDVPDRFRDPKPGGATGRGGGAARGGAADRRGATVLRRIGMAALGLLGGLLGGIVVQDLIAPLLITGAGEVSLLGLILLPLLIPLCGAAGAVIAVLVDARTMSRHRD